MLSLPNHFTLKSRNLTDHTNGRVNADVHISLNPVDNERDPFAI